MLNPIDNDTIAFSEEAAATPSMKITVENVLSVFETLDPMEAQRFEHDLETYENTGNRSAFLLGILAMAAGASAQQIVN